MGTDLDRLALTCPASLTLSFIHSLTRATPFACSLARFEEALVFNQPLNSWDTSKVTDMSNMFVKAKAFNQPLDKWNMINVETIQYMFERAKAFNQDLSMWKVAKINGKRHDCQRFCRYASSYKAPKPDIPNKCTRGCD